MSASDAPQGSATVLVVDDNPDARRAVVRTLEVLGHRVLETGDPETARSWVLDEEEGVDLMVTDVVMPGMSGIRLARELGARRPDLRVLFISGYADQDVQVDDLPLAATAFLEKPMTINELSAKVAGLLEGA